MSATVGLNRPTAATAVDRAARDGAHPDLLTEQVPEIRAISGRTASATSSARPRVPQAAAPSPGQGEALCARREIRVVVSR